jgi:hypothetical protein
MGERSVDAKQSGGRRRSRRWLVAAVGTGLVITGAALAPVAGATSKGPIAASAAPSAGKVTFTKQTVLVPTSTIKRQLISVSANGATYTFKSKHGVLAKLKKNSVMLLQDLAVRDVTKIAKSHGHLVVTTRPAAITDLVANGTMAWDKSISFAKGYAVGGSAVPPAAVSRTARARTSVPSRFGMVPLAGGSGITIKGKTHTYKYSVGFKQQGSAVAVSITISKSSPVEIEAKITGTLDNLTAAGNVAVKHGSVTGAKMLANHLTGDFKLAYSATPISGFGLDKAGGIKITLPAEIAVPFFVGPVPFFLGINVAFFASAGFSSFDQELSGSYTFSYNGAGGISVSKAGATSAAGVLKGLGDIVLAAANAVNSGPLSFVFGAQMPQLELGLGVKGLNVAGTATLIGSTGIATYGPGCDTRQMEIEGVTGAEANFFGFSADLASSTLFDHKIEAAYPKGCGTFPNDGANSTVLTR